jgi:hypothetical protein
MRLIQGVKRSEAIAWQRLRAFTLLLQARIDIGVAWHVVRLAHEQHEKAQRMAEAERWAKRWMKTRATTELRGAKRRLPNAFMVGATIWSPDPNLEGGNMTQTNRQAAQYLCGTCGNGFDSIIELHEHEKVCRELESDFEGLGSNQPVEQLSRSERE